MLSVPFPSLPFRHNPIQFGGILFCSRSLSGYPQRGHQKGDELPPERFIPSGILIPNLFNGENADWCNQKRHHKMVRLQTNLNPGTPKLKHIERSGIGGGKGLKRSKGTGGQKTEGQGRKGSRPLVGFDPISFHFFNQTLTADTQKFGGLNLIMLTLLQGIENQILLKIRNSLVQ